MPSPNRATVTVDGSKFDVVSASVEFNTMKDRAGMPEMGSLHTSIRAWIDFHDDQNMPFSTVKKLFELANVVTRDKIKDIKIEFWKDDNKQDALCSYSFKGWISKFQTSNPIPDTQVSAPELVNHLLLIELEPVMNQQNFKEIKISN
ncbi:MAG: hypothetical protein ACRD11_06500 [Terriglobia bacterium]